MAEKFEIDVDVNTLAGIAAFDALREAIGHAKASIEEAGKSVDSLEQSLSTVAPAAVKTAGELEKMGQQGAKATGEVNKLGDAGTAAAEKYVQAGETGKEAMGKVGNATKTAKGHTSDLTNEVFRWIGAYAGVQSIIMIYDQAIDRMKQAIAAQRELAQGALSLDERFKATMNNLGVMGEAGQRTVRKLTEQVVQQAPVSVETAQAALQVAISGQHDPRTKGGMEFTKELAIGKERLELSEDTLTQFVRTLKGRGMDSAEGLKLAFAKAMSQFKVSHSKNLSQFMEGWVGGVLPQLALGVSDDFSAAVYSAAVSQSPNEARAAEAVKQFFYLAQGTSEQARRFGAKHAAELGVTKIAPVSNKDLEKLVAQRKDDTAKAIYEEQRNLKNAEQNLADEEKAFNDRRPGNRPTRHTPVEIERHEHQMKAAREELEDKKKKIAEDMAKLREEERIRREDEAYLKLSIQERAQRVLLPTFATASTEQQNRITEEVGGQVQSMNVTFMVAQKASQELMKDAVAAMKAAKASDTDKANAAYEETDPAKNQRVQSQITMDDYSAADEGTRYTRRLLDRAKDQRQRKAAAGKYVLDQSSSLTDRVYNIINTESRQLVDESNDILHRDIKSLDTEMYRYWQSMPEGPEKEGFVNGLFKELVTLAVKQQNESQSLGTLPITSGAATVNSEANAFGLIQHGFEVFKRNRTRRSTTRPSTRPSTRPATQPTTQPLSMAGALPEQLASAGGGWDYLGGMDPALAEVLADQLSHAPDSDGQESPLAEEAGELKDITDAAMRHWESVTQNPLATRKKIKAAYEGYRQAKQQSDAAAARSRQAGFHKPSTGKIFMRGPDGQMHEVSIHHHPPTGKIFMRGADGRMREVGRPHHTPTGKIYVRDANGEMREAAIPHHVPTGKISYRDQAGGELKTWPGDIDGALPLPEGAVPTGIVAPADHPMPHTPPISSAAGGPTYNIHVGMIVTQADEDLDLPGRFT